MVRRQGTKWVQLTLLGCLIWFSGCGGDSSVGYTVPPGPGPASPRVSGTVKAPNGSLASLSWMQRLADGLVSTAQALTGSFIPVGRAQTVTLVHRRGDGFEQVLASAFTNDQGQYELGLPENTTEDTCRFLVMAGPMRAFVTASKSPIDIDPLTEATVRLVLNAAGNRLCEYTTQDLIDILRAVRAAPGVVLGNNASEASADAYNRAASDPDVQRALSAPLQVTTATRTFTRTATQVATATWTDTPTTPPTATITFTRVPTSTATRTRTATQVATQTATQSRTATSRPTLTFTPTPTLTETALPTATSTLTSTPVPPSATPSHTLVPTATETFTQLPTPSFTESPTNTVTHTPSVTETATQLPTATQQATATASATVSFTSTQVATATATDTVVPTPTVAVPSFDIDNVSGGQGGRVDVLIRLAKNGVGVVTIAPLEIGYDADVLTPVGCVAAAGVGAGKSAQANIFQPGVLRVVLSGDLTVLPDGAVLDCAFDIAAAASGSTVLQFLSANVADADLVDYQASGDDGSVTISANPSLLISNLLVAPGSSTTIPISLAAAGKKIVTVAPLVVRFDPSVLTVTSCSPAGEAVSAGYDVDFAVPEPGLLRIVLSGSLTGVGSGPIIQCTVQIAPAASGRTSFEFESANLADDAFNDYEAFGSSGVIFFL